MDWEKKNISINHPDSDEHNFFTEKLYNVSEI